jgi:ribonuclease J
LDTWLARARPGAPEIPVTIVPLGGRISLPPFDIEFVSVAHSIPESNALIIRTKLGTLLHTGDWKLDPTPLIGVPTDEAKLRALGDAGCLAVIGDSTNAVREGRSPSESDVAKSLKELIAGAPGRVAVTTFASNVARMRAVAFAARACGREVVLVGRAMERIAQIARETGYFDGVQDFRGTDTYGYLPPDKVVALCTGSQGEPRAALSRIALDEHPDVTLGKGDRVIFSSRTIPGNEKAVGRVINGLVRQGIEVITDRTHLVHVSGHPARDELRRLYRLVKPRYAVPTHGEWRHLSAHAALAQEAGAKPFLLEDGDVLSLAPDAAQVVDSAPVGRLVLDGNRLTPFGGGVMSARRRMLFNGVVLASIAVDANGRLRGEPRVSAPGLFDSDDAELDRVGSEFAEALEDLPISLRRDDAALTDAARAALRRALGRRLQKRPLVDVHLLRV